MSLLLVVGLVPCWVVTVVQLAAVVPVIMSPTRLAAITLHCKTYQPLRNSYMQNAVAVATALESVIRRLCRCCTVNCLQLPLSGAHSQTSMVIFAFMGGRCSWRALASFVNENTYWKLPAHMLNVLRRYSIQLTSIHRNNLRWQIRSSWLAVAFLRRHFDHALVDR